MNRKLKIALIGAIMPFGIVITGCDNTQTIKVPDPNCNHVWDAGVVTQEPTETLNGVKTYTCTLCEGNKTEVIPATGNGGNGNNQQTSSAAYDLVTDLAKLDKAYIVSSYSGASYDAMTATNAEKKEGGTYSWYFNGAQTDVSSTMAGADIKGANAELFTFKKDSDGNYTIQASNNKYLFNYIDGTHYSIGLGDTPTNGGTTKWTITAKNQGFTVKGVGTNVYLSHGDPSFSGNKNEPACPIYFYVKGTGTGTGETTGGNTTGGNTTGGGGTTTGGGGGTVVMPVTDAKWNLDFTKFGATFRDALGSLITAKATKTGSYSSCLSVGKAAAANGSGKYTPFYHGSDYAVSTGADSNREHTWPNSRGGGDKQGGSNIEKDPFMVRPTITADNSARGNNFYGTGANEWDPASCGFEGARGESARVIFYVATRYGKSNGLSLSNNPSDSTGKKTMGTLKYLIQWNRQYPVTDMEKQINEYLFSQGYGRNPFVDHPEYADFIWDENGLRNSLPNITTNGDVTTTGGTTTGGTTTGGTTTGSETNFDYTVFDAIEDLNDAAAYIVSSYDGNSYSAMTNVNVTNAKDGSKYSWYFTGAEATMSPDKTGVNISGANAEKFTIKKQTDGTYTIQASNGNYLFSYIDGTHYSIGIGASPTNGGTKNWNITVSGKGFSVKGVTTNVNLDYSDKGSFCGYKETPKQPIYFCA